MPIQPSDWLDDALWKSVSDNIRAAARFARVVQARGLALDIENYSETPLSTEATTRWLDQPSVGVKYSWPMRKPSSRFSGIF